VSAMHDRCSPTDGDETWAQPGFDAVVEWQLPKPAPALRRDEKGLIVVLEARNPKQQEPTGKLEAEGAGHGSR
jgi:hypothetical protein